MQPLAQKQSKKRRRRWYILGFTLLFILAAIFIGNHYAKKMGYRNLWHFVKTYSSHSSKASSAKFETLKIKIAKPDFEKLERLRQKHLEKGLIENEDGDYVDAKLNWNGKKIDARLRLKGHMTDHLQDKKWSFRIKTKKGDAFMGMKVFSLQHPGTRNYIYEWIYHQMMKQEGIIALNYDFIKVYVNGENWGIYALEEHFAQELVKHNQKTKGPLIRFNPDMYWVFRSQENYHINVDGTYGKFQSSFPEAYDDKTTYGDSALLQRYAKALNLLEQVRRKKIKISQAFDIQKLATFHAIIDLVGGHHSLDWSDVKYYYNPENDLLEPVAYESFSVQNTWQLGGAYKYTANDSSYTNNWHNILFSDPEFFALYVKALYKVSDKKWLDQFFKRIDPELENKLAILYKDYAHREFSMQQYNTNQENIRALLEDVQGLLVYFDRADAQFLDLKIGNINGLPYKISSVDIDSLQNIAVEPVIIDAKQENQYVKFVRVRVKLPAPLSIKSTAKIKVNYTIPGSDKKHSAKIIPVRLEESIQVNREPNFTQFNFIQANGNKLNIIPGKHAIEKAIYIPAGYTLICGPATSLEFKGQGALVSASPLQFNGEEDAHIKIILAGNAEATISILNSAETSFFSNTDFVAAPDQPRIQTALKLYDSPAQVLYCNFSGNIETALRATHSKLSVDRSFFGGLSGHAIKAYYSNVTILKTEFRQVQKNALDFTGTLASVNNTRFSHVKEEALKADEGSEVKASWLIAEDGNTAIIAKDKSVITITGLELNNNQLGLKAYKKGDVFGPAKIVVKKLKHKGNKVLQEAEKKSTITIGS